MKLNDFVEKTPSCRRYLLQCFGAYFFVVSKILAALLIGVTIGCAISIHVTEIARFTPTVIKVDGVEDVLTSDNGRLRQQSAANAQSDLRLSSTVESAASSKSNVSNSTLADNLKPPLFISASQIGRLGNLLFQYATAFGIARLVGKRVYLKSSSELPRLFPALRQHQHVYVSDSDADVVGRHGVGDPKHSGFAPTVIEQSRGAFNVGMGGYYQSWRYFDEYRDELRAQLQFDEPIRVETDKQIDNAKAKALAAFDALRTGESSNTNTSTNTSTSAVNKTVSLTWIGVHIRRGDIVTPHFASYGYLSATPEYLQRSADYFIDKYSRPNSGVVFLVFTDDLEWSKANFRPIRQTTLSNSTDSSNATRPLVYVEFVSNEKREVDLSMMSRCNGTIMTVGSFGWWAAYLAGGETFYYAYPYRAGSDLSKQFVIDNYYLTEWHMFF